MKCEALLFDLDGTLIDSRRDIAEACNAALLEHGHEPLAFEDVVSMIGDGARALVARALRRSGADDEALVDPTLRTFKRFYLAKPCVHTTLLPGALEALAIDLPRAIVTNKPRDLTVAIISQLAIGQHIQALWAGDGTLKPDPEGVLAVAKALGVKPQLAWMIGDGPQDILAGKAAGCFTVAIRGIASPEELAAAQPDLTLHSLRDLASALSQEDRSETETETEMKT